MDRKEQFGEIAVTLCKADCDADGNCEWCDCCNGIGKDIERECRYADMAALLYEKGYRKTENAEDLPEEPAKASYRTPKGFIELTTNEGNKLAINAKEITQVATTESVEMPEECPNCKGVVCTRGEFKVTVVQETYEVIMTKIAEAMNDLQ